jgi:hypothetical protein
VLWLLEAHAPAEVDPKGSSTLLAPKIQAYQLYCLISMLNLLLSGRSPPPHTQVNPRLHALHQEASLSAGHRGPAVTTKPSHRNTPTAPSKSWSPSPPLTGNLPHCGCQEICFPKVQKSPSTPTVLHHGRAPASPLRIENTRLPM